MQEILKKIVDKRFDTIQKKGLTFGVDLPDEREVPVVLPDFENGALICEIKRGSPSAGRMNDIPDPVEWAGKYIEGGANAISILTEEDFFYGSLNDLISVKKRYPGITALRKDFLLSIEEIGISYKSGADMILLITSVLVSLSGNIELLKKMKETAEELGILPLIEVHDKEELELVQPLSPKLIGINSRDLETFKINRGYPIGLKEAIDKDTFVIYESGIRNSTDSFFAGSSGFSGVLVGSSIVKSGDINGKINEIKTGFIKGRQNFSLFYNNIFEKIYIYKKLVVKICGITNLEDAKLCIESGADVLGFIFADSPRKISIDKAKTICKKIGRQVLKVGVVVDENIEEAVNAVKHGWLDAVQFHGDIDNKTASGYNIAWYKAIRVKEKKDFHRDYYSPIILYDAFSKHAMGGTGKQIDEDLLDYAKENNIDLFLAGGINPDNIGEIYNKYKPLMVDVCSGLEKSPGKKDEEKVRRFFENIPG